MVVALVWVIRFRPDWLRRLRARLARALGRRPRPVAAPDEPPPGEPSAEDAEKQLDREELTRLASQAWEARESWARDEDALLVDPSAAEALELLRSADLRDDRAGALLDWARTRAPVGADYVLIALVLELLGERTVDASLRRPIVALAGLGPREALLPYHLRVIRSLARLGTPLLDDLVLVLHPSWGEDDVLRAELAGLLTGLLDAGDEIHPQRLPDWEGEEPPPVVAILERAAGAAPDERHAAQLRQVASRLALVGEALAFVTFVETGGLLARAHLVETAARRDIADAIVEALEQDPPVSVVIHGEAGSGRTSLLRLALDRLGRRGWVVIEATPEQVAAGQIYVNQLDGRLQRLASSTAGRRVVWLIPNLESGLTSARASGDPRSFADRLAPHLAAGRLAVLGELSEDGFQALSREAPALARVVRAVAAPVLDEDELLRVGHAAVEREAERRAVATVAGDDVVRQALELARALLPHMALPGSLARLLAAAVSHTAETDGAAAVQRADLFAGLTAITGMPSRILDDTQRLDLGALHARLARRVLGQPEAIDALVERIALVKAGLCDPGRPYGVFLFVGPTGTGKTELARALADELFGSPDRMVRIDMSELKSPESVERIIGTGDTRGGESLASRIRAQPFSVVLLDEFEKAAPQLWDLFLQVFDAGRLSDRSGQTVDFRQTIVIVTSNLGSAIETRQALGFSEGGTSSFSSERVERAVRDVLRPELINRFDRVIVFRPLARTVMRGIVHKEVQAALQRRGLADRDWAIEIDESAVDFLLESGFTRDLGARPLRRAVERHLLAPLARVIAMQEAPRGEQFLFVSSETDRLDVRFVAADEPDEPSDESRAPATSALSARDVAREGRGRRADLRVLRDTLSTLRELVNEPHWQERKSAALGATSSPGFWDREDRFAVLGVAETMDRIEAQLRSCASLLDRFFALAPGEDVGINPEPVARLARELVQLDRAMQALEAGRAQDALVRVEPGEDGAAFAAELVAMYQAWARRRGAKATPLEAPMSVRARVLYVEGLGAFDALSGEGGLHVSESRHDGRTERLGVVRVTVTPWAEASAPSADGAQAGRPGAEVAVIRRYQSEPTPLVRDIRAGWRTGRIDRVLGGDFDLFAAS